jgi:hypothetical protein
MVDYQLIILPNKIILSLVKVINEISKLRRLRYILPKLQLAKTKTLHPTHGQSQPLEMKIKRVDAALHKTGGAVFIS